MSKPEISKNAPTLAYTSVTAFSGVPHVVMELSHTILVLISARIGIRRSGVLALTKARDTAMFTRKFILLDLHILFHPSLQVLAILCSCAKKKLWS